MIQQRARFHRLSISDLHWSGSFYILRLTNTVRIFSCNLIWVTSSHRITNHHHQTRICSKCLNFLSVETKKIHTHISHLAIFSGYSYAILETFTILLTSSSFYFIFSQQNLCKSFFCMTMRWVVVRRWLRMGKRYEQIEMENKCDWQFNRQTWWLPLPFLSHHDK